jgi:hypothetical protein
VISILVFKLDNQFELAFLIIGCKNNFGRFFVRGNKLGVPPACQLLNRIALLEVEASYLSGAMYLPGLARDQTFEPVAGKSWMNIKTVILEILIINNS